MTHYKSARRIAKTISGLGWAGLALSLAFFVITLIVIFSMMGGVRSLMQAHTSAMLMPGLVGATISLLVVLAGHVARAFFDLVDAVLVQGKPE